MKKIIKDAEPNSLTEYRARGGDYDNLHTDTKDQLRQSLFVEQGYICCYCMKRIPVKLSQEQTNRNYPSNKIEHLRCQARNPQLELNYKNLLIACHGNHGLPSQMQTCDTSKDDHDISFSPADDGRNIEDLIKYKANGEIYSDDSQINSELCDILNLNTKDLRDIRKVYYKEMQSKIILEGKRRRDKNIQRRFYKSEKRKLLEKKDHKYIPYCMIGVYLINKRLAKLT